MTDLLERPRAKSELVATHDNASVIAEGPGALLSAIVALAKDPSVDVVKLQALLEMQERMEERQAKVEFNRSFVRLSGKMPRVKKNGTVDLGAGKGSYPFAKWEDMDRVIRPLMDDEGFGLSFDSAPRAEQGGGITVTGELMHRDGCSKSASISLSLDSGPGRNNLQAMGSSLSYGKRYCAEMLLNIVRAGVDDDGVRGGAEYIGPGQLATIRNLLTATKTDETRFCEWVGVGGIQEIKTDEFTRVVNSLEAKKHKNTASATT